MIYAIKYARNVKTSFSIKSCAVASAKILPLVIETPGTISPSKSNHIQYFSRNPSAMKRGFYMCVTSEIFLINNFQFVSARKK